MLARAVAACQAEFSNDEEDEPVSLLRRTIRKRLPGLLLPGKKDRSSEVGENLRSRSRRGLSETSSASSTPPPSYHTSPRNSLYQAIEDGDNSDGDDTISLSGPTHLVAPTPSLKGTDGLVSGVRWRYAQRGLSLLSLAVDGENSLDQDPRFNRKLYLDSIGHMLQGLPSDLTPEEGASIRRALPDGIARPETLEGRLDVRVNILEAERPKTHERTMLHRTIAAVTFYIIISLNFALPYIQFGLENAYRYDRKHKISDRVLAQGILTANAVSQFAMSAAAMVCAMNDGEVGETMKEVGVWWLRELAGGLCDGVGQGMQSIVPAGPARRRKSRHVQWRSER